MSPASAWADRDRLFRRTIEADDAHCLSSCQLGPSSETPLCNSSFARHWALQREMASTNVEGLDLQDSDSASTDYGTITYGLRVLLRGQVSGAATMVHSSPVEKRTVKGDAVISCRPSQPSSPPTSHPLSLPPWCLPLLPCCDLLRLARQPIPALARPSPADAAKFYYQKYHHIFLPHLSVPLRRCRLSSTARRDKSVLGSFLAVTHRPRPTVFGFQSSTGAGCLPQPTQHVSWWDLGWGGGGRV